MNTNLYSSDDPSNIAGPPFHANGALYLEWNDAPKENDNIIHHVNLSIAFRPTEFIHGTGCTATGIWSDMGLFSYFLSNKYKLFELETDHYYHYEDEVTDYINKNEYIVSIDILEEDSDEFCAYAANATLKVNFTGKGEIDITPLTTYLEIGKGNAADIRFNISCYGEFCGKNTYSIETENGLVTSTDLESDTDLGMEEAEYETITMTILAQEEGEEYIRLVSESYYNGENIGIEGESTVIPVHVTNSNNQGTETPGDLEISYQKISPPMPVPKGDNVTIEYNIICINGFCGEVRSNMWTLLNPLYYSNDTCILNEGETCEFVWIRGSSENNPIDEKSSYDVTFYSLADHVSDVSDRQEIFFTDERIEWTNVDISIDQPVLNEFNLSDEFILSATVSCSGPDCENVKFYAFYEDSDGREDISNETSLYLADMFQKNPVIYSSISTFKRWKLIANKTGTYRLGIRARGLTQSYGTETNNRDGEDLLLLVIQPGSGYQNEDYNDTVNESRDTDGYEPSFTAGIVSPKPSSVFKRGKEIEVRVSVSKDSESCRDCIVRANSIFFEEDLILTYSNGIYSGKAKISNKASGLGKIIFDINGKLKKNIEIVVEPRISVTATTDKDSYEINDIMKIMGVVPSKAYVSGEIICGNNFRKDISAEQAGINGDFTLENELTKEVPGGSCLLKVKAVDRNGNHGEKNIDVIISHPVERNILSVSIFSPRFSDRVVKGETQKIDVRVSRKDEPVTGSFVRCSGINGEEINLTDEGGGVYKSGYRIDVHENKSEWMLSCLATKDNLYGSNSMIMPLSESMIIIRVIEPEPFEHVEPGETLKIKVKATYEDGTPVDAANIRMKTNGNQEVTLKPGVNGEYVGNFIAANSGVMSFDFSASDNMGVSGELDKVLFNVKEQDLSGYIIYLIIAAVIIIALLLGVILFERKNSSGRTTVITRTEKIDMDDIEKKVEKKHMFDRRLVIKEKLRDLQIEYENINSDIDMLHSEYYKREIDEETFVKLLQERKERKENISSTMNKLTKELKNIEGSKEFREDNKDDDGGNDGK